MRENPEKKKERRKEASISLYVHDHPKPSPSFLSVEWPTGKPLLWVELSCSSRIAVEVDSAFVVSNTPPGHSVFFAATTRNNHNKMMAALRKEGDSFEIKALETKRVATTSHKIINRMAGRKEKAETLFGVTRSASIVKEIFNDYLDWRASHVFPFLITADEPPDWKKNITGLIAGPPRVLQQELIEKCHCIMATLWDHGVILVSDKVSKTEIESLTREIASKQQVEMHTIMIS